MATMKTKTTTVLLMLLLAMPAALAQVAITEIMYAPNQTASETDSEWIELYNPGLSPVNLTGWTVNGNAFGSATMASKQYIVVARELTDSDDADNDSFQSVWGTGVNAVDGSFILGNTGGTIELRDQQGNVSDSVTYSASQGALKNGRTLEKTGEGWKESTAYGGTPGYALSANASQPLQDEVAITLSLDNSEPVVQSASYDATKIYATVYDANGLDDITGVYAKIASSVVNMMLEATTFKGELPKLAPGSYDATVFAQDSYATGNKTITVVIETIASLNVIQEALSFANIKAGETREATLEIENSGNVDLQLDFDVAGEEALSANLQCYDTSWKNATDCSVTIPSGARQSISLKLSVPEGTKAGQYSAKLQTTATVL